MIRWASPVNYMKRTVMQDAQVRGQKMKEGDALVQFYASANRDEEVFEDPFKFDITRKPNRHLGFGTGEHFCLGAHVARMSARALLEEMANRIEVLEPAGPSSMIESSFVVGLKTLPVHLQDQARRVGSNPLVSSAGTRSARCWKPSEGPASAAPAHRGPIGFESC